MANSSIRHMIQIDHQDGYTERVPAASSGLRIVMLQG